MAQPYEKKLNELLALCQELKTDFNNLRQDFMRHDHGSGSYEPATIRIAVGDLTVEGTLASSPVSAGVPSDMFKV